MQKLDDLSRDVWRAWAAKLLDDEGAQHLAEVIHERRTTARTLDASWRATQPRAAPSRSLVLLPPPRPPQGSYAETVGWTFDGMPMEGGIYWAIKSGEKLVGGIYEMKGPHFAKMPEHWLTYIAVDDVDAWVEKTTAAAATVIHPAFDIGGVGRIVILREPGGAVVGWMTPSS